MKRLILIIIIISCILSIVGCEKTEIMEENQIYEIYSHQFLYVSHNIVKSAYNFSAILDKKEIDDSDIDLVSKYFEDLELVLGSVKELPKPIDEETKEIYNFLNKKLYPRFVAAKKDFEKKKLRNEINHKCLEGYVEFFRKIETDVKWIDINLNTKELKGSKVKLNNKEIIKIIVQDIHRLKEIIEE